jgi:hypothetical protein
MGTDKNMSIFHSISVKDCNDMPVEYDYSTGKVIRTDRNMKSYDIVYRTDKDINGVDAIEFQIANDYVKKRFGFALDEIKDFCPEIFLVK